MNNDFFQSYQTAEWQRLKNKVLERDNYTCQICGERHSLMQVHHITYKRCGGKAYNAPIGNLITLCEDCHNHDDGDHRHFFGGKIVIREGNHFNGNKPTVLDLRRYNNPITAAKETCQSICNYEIEPNEVVRVYMSGHNNPIIGIFTNKDSKNLMLDFLMTSNGVRTIFAFKAEIRIKDISNIKFVDFINCLRIKNHFLEKVPEIADSRLRCINGERCAWHLNGTHLFMLETALGLTHT